MTAPPERVKTITESGWYRPADGRWEYVAPPGTAIEDVEVDGGGWDLVHVEFEGEEARLW